MPEASVHGIGVEEDNPMKVDFSQAKVQAVGTAFKAMSIEVNTKTKQQLEAEESVGQSSDSFKASDSSKTEDKTVSPNDNEQTILFADPTNGNLVKIDLSKANIEKLKEHFTDENNFYERQDGSIRLNGKAEAYVSGWFGDIAYKREFLKADADRDGKLSEEEFGHSKGSFWVESEAQGIGNNVSSVTETVTKTYLQRNDALSGRHYSDSIQTALNKTLKADINFDSSETYEEFFVGNNVDARSDIIGYARTYLDDIGSKKGYFSGGGQTDEEMALLMLQSRAAQKLLAADGNESVLTAEEKEALGTELKAIKKQLESKDELSSIKDELKIKIENTQFIDVRG